MPGQTRKLAGVAAVIKGVEALQWFNFATSVLAVMGTTGDIFKKSKK